MSENLEQNLNDNVGKQGLERNLNKNLSENVRENLSKNAEAGANKNSCENLRESKQCPENLYKNSSQAAPNCKAQNFFKKTLELFASRCSGCAYLHWQGWSVAIKRFKLPKRRGAKS